MRKVLVVAALVLLAVSAGSVAYATSATGTQNPDLTVFISYSPDCVQPGDTLVRSYSVTNNTHRGQNVALEWTATRDGVVIVYRSWSRTLRPDETWGAGPTTFTISTTEPRGTYAVTLSATNRNGTSSATATVQVADRCA